MKLEYILSFNDIVMVYKTLQGGKIQYIGNKLNPQQKINFKDIETSLLKNRVNRIKKEKLFYHLANIDHGVFSATVEYFLRLKARWTNLPLTTLMISSPGEVYAGQTLDYTTDTLPIELPNWFGEKRKIFLAESSQFYLELQLLIQKIDQVFSIYNSFRKEKSDATHLSEFQHIEYEGRTNLNGVVDVFMELFNYIFDFLLKNNKEDLLFFLSDEILLKKRELIKKGPIRISFSEALNILYKDTKLDKYKEFSLKYFGTWEEIRITEILDANVIIDKYPMLQIPFYHQIANEKVNGIPVAQNADFILYGYRETIGSGERIRDKKMLLKKAEIFNLPKEDYMPYLQSRDFSDYQITSGFGMGWQRLVQWLTNQPYIYESTIFPRTHLVPNP